MSTKRSKRYQEAAKLVTPNKNYSISEAVETMKSFPAPKFDPTVTVSFHLTVDPRKSDQMVSGSVSLPNGTGKNVRVLVFAQGDAAKAAEEAGAMMVGDADLIAKIPAGADWMLSDAVGSEPMDDFAFGLVQDGLKEALSDPAGVHAGNVEKVEQLAEGLLLSGFAMQATQSSRPASGAEHQFSHLWDMEHLKYNGASVSHGFKVGIGTLASTAFLEMLLDAPVEQLDIERCVAAWKSWDETERDIRAIFNDDPEFVARGLKETRDKYVDREGLRDQLTRLKKAWPELRERIRRQIIPFDEVRRRLELVGAPYEPEQIGVSRTRFREAFGKIPYMRSRYTVIDTAFRCGWMEEWLDRLFGKGGFWEFGIPAPGSGEPARSAAAPAPGA